MDKIIVQIAMTGNLHLKTDNENLPITPQEVGEDALRCYNQGASIFHIHARDRMGNSTYLASRFRLYIDEIRKRVPDAVICASCSGRHHQEFNERSQVLLLSGVDMATLTLGSFNFAVDASVNRPAMIRALAREMKVNGIKPELECFDLGHVFYAHRLLNKGHLDTPLWFNLFLGNLGTIPATKEFLSLMVDSLPDNSIWSAAGLGRFQWSVNQWAIALGGHVRTGLEDSIYMDEDKNELASNVKLVERVVSTAKSVGREPTTIEETREVLGL